MRGVVLPIYSSRYDVQLNDFHLEEEPTDNADGVFEFGEVANTTGFWFGNVGGMPTPEQRIRVTQVNIPSPAH